MALINDLEQSLLDILDVIDGLKNKDLKQPDTIGNWSIKDVLLHIAMWEGEVIKEFSIWRNGFDVDWSYVQGKKGIQKFNNFWIENISHLSTGKVIEMLKQNHNALVADVKSVSNDTLKKRGGIPKWLPEIVIEHNRHHVDKIRAFRNQKKM